MRVIRNKNTNMFWDFIIHSDRGNQKTGYCSFDKQTLAYNIGIAVPGNFEVKDKKLERRVNYHNLAVKISRVWNVKKRVVPIGIDALRGKHRLIKGLVLLCVQ